ncbi:sensor histidine kinase [Sphingomonas sp. Leaf25]|uniref:sensor histidine kinase n=1 Tax=Sphingomonas sp. Leaf25 TaxID=1735692 RepID=UPI000ACAD402|nr:PAS domain-containing protein [Sphingomonas sp. Leaf25]
MTSVSTGATHADPLWHEIVDTLPLPAWVSDFDGRLLRVNPCWDKKISDRWQGSSWIDHLIEADRAETVAAWHAAAHRAPLTIPATLIGRDGPYRATLTLRPLTVTQAQGAWIGIALDAEAGLRAETDRAATQAELDTLTNAMPQMVWATRPDGHHDFYNAQWYRFTGVPAGSTDGEGWNGMFHPDDQERAWARWRHSLATGNDYEIEYRLRHHSGTYRWVLGRAVPVRDAEGAIVRWIGTCTDIDAAKRAAEQNEILSRELSHRIKNIFAVITGLLRMSARREPAMRDFADVLAARIAALGVAHDLARPHSERSRPSIGDATLHHVLAELLSPYDAGQWRIAGEDTPIDDRGATPVALVFHELATNAAKYGSLSVPDGRVTIEIGRTDDRLTIDWRETGGPPADRAPGTTGFGTRLAALSVEQQLGGTITRDWRAEGLAVRIEITGSALVRG